MTPRDGPERGFEHDALLYAGDAGFVAGTLPFLREGLEAEEPMLAVLTRPSLALLREALGEDAGQVRFADMLDVGTNPARMIAAWREFVDARDDDGPPVRGIGESIWAGRSDAELAECHRHESLLNVAFADTPAFRLLCPYDTSALPAKVIEQAGRSHPFLRAAGTRSRSEEYVGAEALAAPFTEPLPEPRLEPLELGFDNASLAQLRRAVSRSALEAGLSEERSYDLTLATSEVVSNSLVHGGGRGTLRIWQDDGHLVCEIRDAGRTGDPLAGRVRPGGAALSGRGLWIANQLCELVQIRSTPQGNVVRLHMRRR